MTNKVVLKRSAVQGKIPSTSDLALGELALNTHDGNLFFKKDDGSESIQSVATLTGTQTLTNKTLSSLVIDGTLTLNGSVGTAGQVIQSTGSGLQWADLQTQPQGAVIVDYGLVIESVSSSQDYGILS